MGNENCWLFLDSLFTFSYSNSMYDIVADFHAVIISSASIFNSTSNDTSCLLSWYFHQVVHYYSEFPFLINCCHLSPINVGIKLGSTKYLKMNNFVLFTMNCICQSLKLIWISYEILHNPFLILLCWIFNQP